jgi:hypothetical protein
MQIWNDSHWILTAQTSMSKSEQFVSVFSVIWFKWSSTNIHALPFKAEDLGVPSFEDHTRALTESYDWKLGGVGNPLVRQLGRYLRWPRADASCRMRKLREQPTSRGRMQNGGQVDIETCSILTSWAHFGHPDWDFTVIFLSCKVNGRVKLNSRGTARIPLPPAGTAASPKCPLRIHYTNMPPWVQLPGTHPTKVFPPRIGRLCAPRAVAFSVTSPGRESGL